MASKKKIFRIGNNLDPFAQVKLKDLPREANAIKNMTFDEWGNLCKRAGYAKYNTVALIENLKITGLHRFYKQTESSKYTLAVSGTKLYDLTDATDHLGTPIKESLTTGADTYFIDFVDRCLIANGEEDLMKTDGTTVYSSSAGQGGLSVEFLLSTGWTYTGWTGSWAAGWTHTTGNTTVLSQSKAAVNLTIYQITYTVTGRTAGSFTIAFGGQSKAAVSASAIWELTTSSTANLTVTPTTGFDGTIVIGIKSMSIPTGVAAGSGGSLSAGNYMFKVTYVDADKNEGNASTSSATIEAVVDDSITVTLPVNADTNYNIVKRKIYRTLAGGASFYEDGYLADNTTTTFVSTQFDTALVQANSLENYHGQDHNAPPSAPSLMAKRGGRIYLAVNQKLYHSKRFYEYFPAEYWIAVGNMRNITGIINQLHTLQVSTKNSIERLLGTSAQIESADYFQFKDSYSSKGVVAPRSQVDCDNYIIFLNKDGLYVLNIDQVRPLNDILNAYLKANMDQTYIDKSCATFYDGLYMLSYPKSGAIGTITLNAGGTDYTALDVLTVVQSGGSSATVRVDTVTAGVIQTITLLFKGSGYTVADGLSTTGGTGTGGKINFTVANTVPSETVYYDFNNNTYGIFDFAFNVYSVWGQDGEDSLKAGSTTIGRVYDVFSGLDDDEAAIEAYDTLPYLYFGTPDTFKMVYNVYIKIKSTTGTALRLYYTLDDDSGLGTETHKDVTLTASTTKWYKVNFPSGVRCRGIKLRPRMSDKLYWELQGIHCIYREEEPLWGSE